MISDQARPFYKDLTNDLLAFYLAEGKSLDDAQLFLRVSMLFGDRMLAPGGVCDGLHLEIGECTIGAIEVMKEAAAKLDADLKGMVENPNVIEEIKEALASTDAPQASPPAKE